VDVRYGTHYGLKSDIARGPKSAIFGLILFLAIVVACLFPIALLIEWALRKMSGR
jgi:hypothetical protein